MLKKLTADCLGWPKQLKFCLFTLCNMPNGDTGYSPYQLIHGSELHGPLELYHGWFGEERECIELGNWMNKIGQTFGCDSVSFGRETNI